MGMVVYGKFPICPTGVRLSAAAAFAVAWFAYGKAFVRAIRYLTTGLPVTRFSVFLSLKLG